MKHPVHSDALMMIVGLGNPGSKYAETRHNIGFMVIDALQTHLSDPTGLGYIFKHTTSAQPAAEVAKAENVVLVKPQTFMNASGEAVQALSKFYHLDPSQLYVVHDDLDIALGSFKIQLGTGPKIHNGLGSLYQHLHTQDFWHVRVGVDGRQGDRSQPGHAYVLQPFQTDEQRIIDQVINQVVTALIRLITTG